MLLFFCLRSFWIEGKHLLSDSRKASNWFDIFWLGLKLLFTSKLSMTNCIDRLALIATYFSIKLQEKRNPNKIKRTYLDGNPFLIPCSIRLVLFNLVATDNKSTKLWVSFFPHFLTNANVDKLIRMWMFPQREPRSSKREQVMYFFT